MGHFSSHHIKTDNRFVIDKIYLAIVIFIRRHNRIFALEENSLGTDSFNPSPFRVRVAFTKLKTYD